MVSKLTKPRKRSGTAKPSQPEASKSEASKPEAPKPEVQPEAAKTEASKHESTKRIVPKPLEGRRLDIANLIISEFGDDYPEVEALVAFKNLSPAEKVSESRKLIQNSVIESSEKPDSRFPLAVAESESLLNGYATLDDTHRYEINNFISSIRSYLRDGTRKRPLNTLMLATPGAGKSHFIKKIASTLEEERVQAVTFNMATMQSAVDLAQPIDELRNIKVNDKFPLLFLDEFDSDPSRYAALLPLLWDGELQVGHRDLKLGKSVIVLAGSSPVLPKAMDQSGKMRLEADVADNIMLAGKLLDLLSRINGGVISIPDLDLRTKQRDRRVDKVCVAVGLIRGRFGNDVAEVPRSLLRFIAHTTFRYSVRSIAHLIDLIDRDAFREGVLRSDALALPISTEEKLRDSSLKLHLLDKDQAFGIVNRWKEFSKDSTMVSLKESKLSVMARLLDNPLRRWAL